MDGCDRRTKKRRHTSHVSPRELIYPMLSPKEAFKCTRSITCSCEFRRKRREMMTVASEHLPALKTPQR